MAEEIEWQKALGTIKKYTGQVNVSFAVTFRTEVMIEGVNDDDAANEFQKLLESPKGKRNVLCNLSKELLEEHLQNLKIHCEYGNLDNFAFSNIVIFVHNTEDLDNDM